jgi:hypothetical protein
MRKQTAVTAFPLLVSLLAGGGHAASLSEAELRKQLASFGPHFHVARIEAPTIDNVHDWINRKAGYYRYQFVEGSDDGAEFQLEKHVPDSANPDSAWTRHIGDTLVESFVSSAERDVLIVEEVDHRHGFRVVIEPGVHLPAVIEPGAVWEVNANLRVYDLKDGSMAHQGKIEASNSYEGAFRIKTPAGEFDAILIREDFLLHIGPLKADDDRLLFYARGVGLVAEVEGVRASALMVYRTKEHSAKVLVEYPPPADPNAAAE